MRSSTDDIYTPTRTETRRLKRAARNAGYPLREFCRRAVTRPEQGPPSMTRLSAAALRWISRKGIGISQ